MFYEGLHDARLSLVLCMSVLRLTFKRSASPILVPPVVIIMSAAASPFRNAASCNSILQYGNQHSTLALRTLNSRIGRDPDVHHIVAQALQCRLE